MYFVRTSIYSTNRQIIKTKQTKKQNSTKTVIHIFEGKKKKRLFFFKIVDCFQEVEES